MASEWFDKVTGSNDYERQSWRDNYNGGRAAGDWTGNNNARIDAERASHDGGTHSGSSFQDRYSREEMNLAMKHGITLPALVQMARDPGPGVEVRHQSASTGPGVTYASTGAGVIAGPGAPGVPTGATTGPGAPAASTKGGGGSLSFSFGPGMNPFAGPAPLKPKIKDTATGGFTGFEVKGNPWFSDVENFGEPRYGEPGEWLGGILNIGADVFYNLPRAWEAYDNAPKVPTGTTSTRLLETLAPKPFAGSWGEPNEPMAPMGKPGSLNW